MPDPETEATKARSSALTPEQSRQRERERQRITRAAAGWRVMFWSRLRAHRARNN